LENLFIPPTDIETIVPKQRIRKRREAERSKWLSFPYLLWMSLQQQLQTITDSLFKKNKKTKFEFIDDKDNNEHI
jgi:hypothetical protein